MEENINKKVKSSLVWKFAERICAQGISFVISLLLARILMPEDYGTISLVLVFISLANIFVTNGLSTGLIQKKDATETDFSTIFYCNLALSVILYGILFLFAPCIAQFYNNMELTNIIRVLSLKIPISSINTIQHAYVSRNLVFKKFFYATLLGTIISGIVGVEMAYKGFGVWALVAQTLITVIVNTIVLLFLVPWKPQLKFSVKSVKELIGFSSKVTVGSLISNAYNEIRAIVIGKVYSSADLAYYKKGNSFPDLIINNIDTTIGSVLFPTLSRYNDDKDKIKALTKKALRTSSYIIYPMLIGLFVTAEPLIKLLLTEKWIFAVPFMQIGCICQLTMTISTANLQAIKALGRSDISLKMEMLKKTIGLLIIFSVMNISVMAIAISGLLYSVIASIINIYPNKKLINYGFKEQIKDLLPSFIMAIVMGIVTYSILFLNLSWISTIVLQVLIGSIVYLGLSYLFKIEEFYLIKNTIVDFWGKYAKKN